MESILEFMSCNWLALAGLVLAAIGVIVAVWQLNAMRRATQAQSYSLVLGRLQDEHVRKARSTLFSLEGKAFKNWAPEEMDAAEIVCHTYDAAAQMVRNQFISRDIIIKSWGPSLRRSWPIAKLLVNHRREQWKAQEIWDDYEWLAKEAGAPDGSTT